MTFGQVDNIFQKIKNDNSYFSYFSFVPNPYPNKNIINYSLSNALKDFQLICPNGSVFYVNKTIIYHSSKYIEQLINESDINSYTVKFQSESIISKFASIINGNSEFFSDDEIGLIPEFCKELDLVGFPTWLRSNTLNKKNDYKFKNLFSLPLSISLDSFQLFLKTPAKNDVIIETNRNTYYVPLFGALTSETFAEFYKSIDTSSDRITFHYDVDNLNHDAFKHIIYFMHGNSFICNKIELILKYAKDLKIQFIIDDIELQIKKSEEIKQKGRNNLHLLHPTDELVSKLLSMKPPTSASVESAFEYIISNWVNDIDQVQTLIFVIFYISTYNVKIHKKIIDIIELLDKAKTEHKVLTNFIKQLTEIFLTKESRMFADFSSDICDIFSCRPIIFGLLRRKLIQPYNIVWLLHSTNFAYNFYNTIQNYKTTTTENDKNPIESYFSPQYFSISEKLFLPEFESLFPGCFLFDFKTDESMRSIEGEDGSLKRIIYDDDVEMLKEYVKSRPKFRFSQTIVTIVKDHLSKLSILEFAAMAESPTVFEFILSNSRMKFAIGPNEHIMEIPELLTNTAITASFGNPEIMKIIEPYLSNCILAHLYSSKSPGNVAHYYSFMAINKRDLETYKLIHNLYLNAPFGSDDLNNLNFEAGFNGATDLVEACATYNTEIVNYLLEPNNFPLISPIFTFSYTFYNTGIYSFLLNTFDLSFTQNRNYDDLTLIPANTESYRILYDIYKNHSKDYPFVSLLKSAIPVFKFDYLKFFLEKLNYKISSHEIPVLITPFVDDHPEVAKLIFNHCTVTDDDIINFIEVAAADTDTDFIQMLIQKQLKINPRTTFERAFNSAMRACNLEMAILIDHIKNEDDDSYVPLRNICDIDYLSTLKLIVRRTIRFGHAIQTNDFIHISVNKSKKLLKLYLKYCKGIALERAVTEILFESVALNNSEIALFALSYKIIVPYILLMASYANMIDVVKKIIEIHPEPEFYNFSNTILGTALNIACKKGNESIVDFLLNLPNIQISTYPNPLVSAAFNRNYQIFVKLLKRDVFTENDINLALLSYIKASDNGVLFPRQDNNQNKLFQDKGNFTRKDLTLMNESGSETYVSFSDLLATPKLVDKEEFLSFFFNKNDKYDCKNDLDEIILNKYRNMINFQFYDNSETFLIVAANMGRTEIVRLLLQNPTVNVNDYDKFGNTALMHAIFNGHFDIVQLLCEMRSNEIDINHQNFSSRTALTFSAYLNRYDIFEYLTKQKGFDYTKSHIVTALEAAIIGKNYNFINIFFDTSKYSYVKSMGFDKYNQNNYQMMNSLLTCCYEQFDIPTLRLILSNTSFDRNLVQNVAKTLLFSTIRSLVVFKEVVEIANIDINTNYQGSSLLYNSIIINNPSISKYIINSPNFDPIQSQINQCFVRAITNLSDNKDYEGIIELLLKFDGINYNEQISPLIRSKSVGEPLEKSNRVTPLVMASNYPNVFRRMLKLPNINVNARTESGFTPIFYVSTSQTLLIELLQRKDIDVNAQDNDGCTFIMYYATKQNFGKKSALPKFLFYRKDLNLSLRNKAGLNVIQIIDKTFHDDPSVLSKEKLFEILSKTFQLY